MKEYTKDLKGRREASMLLISEVLKDSPNQSLINELLLVLDIPASTDPIEQLENIYKHVESNSFKALFQKEV